MWPTSIFSQALSHLPTSVYGLTGIGFIILGFIALAVIRLHKEPVVSQRTFFAVGILFLGLLFEVHFAQESRAPSALASGNHQVDASPSVSGPPKEENQSPSPSTSPGATETPGNAGAPAVLIRPCAWSPNGGQGADSFRNYTIIYKIRNQGQVPMTRVIVQYTVTDTAGAPMTEPRTYEPIINVMIPVGGIFSVSDNMYFNMNEPSSALASITCKIIAVYGPGGYAWTAPE